MTYKLQCLSFAESQIYSMSAFYRVVPSNADEMLRAVWLDATKVIFAGMKQDYEFDANIFKDHFIEFRNRPSQYFDHADMQLNHYKLWSHNCYFLPTNWLFRFSTRMNDDLLFAQYGFGTNLSRTPFDFARAAKECELNQYGHLVAPWGFCDLPEDSALPRDGTPYCSCGSFQGQWQNLDEFKKILGDDYQPGCKHISYMRKIAEYKGKRQKVQEQQDKDRAYKSAAVFARTPRNELSDPELLVLYTEDRSTVQIDKWKFYNSGKPIPASESWNLLDRILNTGYLTFMGHKLPNLANFKPENVNTTTTDE